jgi:predicted phosphohydrolase
MPEIKLAITSDLHWPMTPEPAIADMAQQVARYDPRALILAGDVAELLHGLTECLALIKQFVTCPIWMLPGNHDLWHRTVSSQRLWEGRLRETVETSGCHWLEGRSFVVDGVGVAGTVAWYDYSAADPSVHTTAYTFARKKQYFNMDAQYIDWPWSDQEFAAMVAEPFLAEMDKLDADDAVRQTVVVTHVPLLECQMCRRPDNLDWSFSNAYFGNLTLGAKVLQRRKVTHIISGHTHVERQGTEARADGRLVEARVLASDYGDPHWVGLSLPMS